MQIHFLRRTLTLDKKRSLSLELQPIFLPNLFKLWNWFAAVVVLAFFICWLPFHAQRLGYVYFLDTKWFRTANEYFTYLTGICYYVSSTINPIVYNVMSAKYRAAFRKTLCGIQPGNGLQNNLTLHKSAVGGDQSQLPRYGQVQRNRRATVPMTEETSMQPQPHNVMVLIL